MGSGLAQPGGCDRGAQSRPVAEVDVQPGQRLEVARVLQPTRVHHLEAHAFGQGAGQLLGAVAVAGQEDAGLAVAAEVGTGGILQASALDNIILNGGTFSGGASALTLTNNVALYAASTVANANDLTFSGPLSGGGAWNLLASRGVRPRITRS